MFHTFPDFSVVTTNWRTRPPTGPELRRALARLLPDGDFQGMLSREMNRSATYVEWCLKAKLSCLPACSRRPFASSTIDKRSLWIAQCEGQQALYNALDQAEFLSLVCFDIPIFRC